MLADGVPAGTGVGLGDKLLRAVPIADDDQDRTQTVVPETPIELREVHPLGPTPIQRAASLGGVIPGAWPIVATVPRV